MPLLPERSDRLAQLAVNRGGLIITIGLTIALLFILGALVFLEVPDKNQNALLLVIGALTTNIGNIVAYYFSGSIGSKQQGDTINEQAKANAAMAQAAAPIVAAVAPTVAATPPTDPPADVTLPAGASVKVEAAPEKPPAD